MKKLSKYQLKPSRTAEDVAAARALESGRSGHRLFSDPYARDFLGLRYKLLALAGRIPVIDRLVEWCIDRTRSSGARTSLIVRTRIIDDLLQSALQDGIRQVILLGAGYDCRPYRLPLRPDVSVFEVDQGTTQNRKRAVLQQRLPMASLEATKFVPVDFTNGGDHNRIIEAGLLPERTVVIMEGVTVYLTKNEIDATLKWIANNTGTGSRLIFTYMHRGAVDGSTQFAGAQQWASDVKKVGEPFKSGFEPAEIRDYLASCNLKLELDMSAEEGAERYLRPLRRNDKGPRFSRLAQAQVC